MNDRVQSRATAVPKPPFAPVRSDLLQRKCACGGTPGLDGECAECRKKHLQRRPAGWIESSTAPPIVYQVLRSTGQPLDSATREFMEPRFGHDFSRVRVHTDARAAESARSVNALAYTVGRDVIFGAGQYAPQTMVGQRLLAHELAHVVQQSSAPMANITVGRARTDDLADSLERASERAAAEAVTDRPERTRGSTLRPRTQGSTPFLQRQETPSTASVEDPIDVAMSDPRHYPPGAPNAVACAPPSYCPGGFCKPYSSESQARYDRRRNLYWLLMGISAFLDSRVASLWREHLLGGSPPKNLTSQFAQDFTNSEATKETTEFLLTAMKKSLEVSPPTFPVGTGISSVTEDFSGRLAAKLTEIDDPRGANRMNFDRPRDVAGNLAGDIGKDQTACRAGARPSPFDDERAARVTATITRMPSIFSGEDEIIVHVQPSIVFTVRDTIDLCPGNCGAPGEWTATVLISQFEATGISGDVPFTVEFPAPPELLEPFTLTLPIRPPASPPATPPSPPPAFPF